MRDTPINGDIVSVITVLNGSLTLIIDSNSGRVIEASNWTTLAETSLVDGRFYCRAVDNHPYPYSIAYHFDPHRPHLRRKPGVPIRHADGCINAAALEWSTTVEKGRTA